jgi:hypothetical protein
MKTKLINYAKTKFPMIFILGFLVFAFTVTPPIKSEETCLKHGEFLEAYIPVEGYGCWQQCSYNNWMYMGPEISCEASWLPHVCQEYFCDVLARPWMCMRGPLPDTLWSSTNQ